MSRAALWTVESEGGVSDDADTNHSRQRVERWFLSRGLPHFVDDYSATRDVFTRALPALTLFLLFEVIGALNFEWAWWVNVLVAAGCFAALDRKSTRLNSSHSQISYAVFCL